MIKQGKNKPWFLVIDAMCKFRVITSLFFRRSNLFDVPKIASSSRQKTAGLLAMTHERNLHITLIVVSLMGFVIGGNVPEGFCERSYDIKEMTPQIKSALESRRNRFEMLRAFKERGSIGENNSGYVTLLVDDPEAKALVGEENNDRRLIYKTIVEQNNLSADALATIESVFAQEQRERANPGEKIQEAGGRWITK